MFFLIDVFFSLEVMYAFAIPFPPSSSAAPAGAGQVSLRGMGQPWVVGAGWNSHAHTTATCSGSTISWPGTMAWQTPGVGGGSVLCQGEREKCTSRAQREAARRGGCTCCGHPPLSRGDHNAPSFCILPFQQTHSPEIHSVWNCQPVPLKDIGRATTTPE